MRTIVAALLLALAGGLVPVATAAAPPTYELLSVNSRERAPDDRTYDADVSRTGRYVVFTSSGTNLSAKDPKGAHDTAEDVYLRDLRRGTTKLVSLATDGHPARAAYEAAISPNGRFVAFCSLDATLVKPDSLDLVGWERDVDVFVRDLRTGVTRRASTTWKGKEADDWSCFPRVADNGDTVFTSLATNMVRREDTGQGHDTFLWDWSTKKVRWVGEGGGGSAFGADISADGRVVAFTDGHGRVDSDTNGRADAYLLLRDKNRLRVVSHRADGGQLQVGCDPLVDLDDDARFLLVSCRDGAMADPPVPDATAHLFVVDLRRHTNTLVNRSTVADPYVLAAALADDGRSVAFVGQVGSYGGLPADDLAVYLWRRGRGLVNLTPGADDTWSDPALALSGDGSLVAFTTDSRTISDQDPEDGALQPQIDLFGVRVP